jgi:hypothetical protein
MQKTNNVTITKVREQGLTFSWLVEHFDYDPGTGLLTRKKTGRVYDTPASSGYVLISVSGRTYMAQNLAWLYVHGELPDCVVDHIDRDRSNNRITNLRLATKRENAQNKSLARNSRSGVKGVHPVKGRGLWRAEIYVNGDRKKIGYFKDFDEAVAARRSAELLHHSHSQEALS